MVSMQPAIASLGRLSIERKQKHKRLPLPGYSCSGKLGCLGAYPEGPGATTWRMEPTTSHHITGRTTDAEHVSAGAVGR